MSCSFLGFFSVVDVKAGVEGLEPLRFVLFVIGTVSVSSSSMMMIVFRCVFALLVSVGGWEVFVGVNVGPLLGPVAVFGRDTVGGVFGLGVEHDED
jgi:hypothetical protein